MKLNKTKIAYILRKRKQEMSSYNKRTGKSEQVFNIRDFIPYWGLKHFSRRIEDTNGEITNTAPLYTGVTAFTQAMYIAIPIILTFSILQGCLENRV
jgi:hypothetical protein